MRPVLVATGQGFVVRYAGTRYDWHRNDGCSAAPQEVKHSFIANLQDGFTLTTVCDVFKLDMMAAIRAYKAV